MFKLEVIEESLKSKEILKALSQYLFSQKNEILKIVFVSGLFLFLCYCVIIITIGVFIAMVNVENLVVNYGNFKAVDKISFKIKEGELFAFLGTNGAGKTTTINVLCGLKAKNSGKVIIDGKDIEHNLKDIKKEIAIVFQHNVLDEFLTVKENLLLRAKLYEIDSGIIKNNFDYLVEKLELTPILNKRYGKLSGGQKRKTDVAKALMSEPKFLILDEPTTGLDPQTRKNLWAVLLELKAKKKMTILLTTHYMEEAKDADNVVIIHQGKIMAEGSPAKLKEKYANDRLNIYHPSVYDY